MLKRTCNFFQHAFQEVLLLALLHLLRGDRILEGQDVVAEPQLLPDRQRGESSLQGDLRKVKHLIIILFSLLKKQFNCLSRSQLRVPVGEADGYTLY